MNERAVRFGPDGHLMGVISEPPPAVSEVRRAVLLSNVGMLSRIGPFRLYVELARTMAGSGWWALRYDESGLGESAPRAEGSSLVLGQDVIDAMDFMQATHGVEQFVLLGLCSGVDSMHAAGVRDPRVTGAVFIDGYTYPTPAYYLRRCLRVLDVARWRRYAGRRLDQWRRPRPPNPSAAVFDRVYPIREQFRRDIASLARRGSHVLFIYTATVDRAFNARRQLSEMLGAALDPSRITTVHANTSDHLFTRADTRAELIGLVQTWLNEVG